MTSAEAVAHVECTKAGLLANAQSQALATEQSNPALRFMEVLRNLYVQNKIALKPIGQALVPYNAHGAAEVGWRDETHAFVLADAALVAVNKELAAMNEAQPVRGYGLWTRMVEDRYIEPAGAEPTHKFDGEGKGVRVRVLKMGLRVLQGTGGDDLDPDDGPGGGEDEDEEWPAPDDDGVEPPDVPLDRLLRSRPANDASVRMSGSRPDLSKLPDKNAEVAEVIGTSTQNAVQGTLKSPLVRMSGSSEGRVVHERGVFTPMGGGEGRVKYRPVEDLYPGETRTSGHPDKNGFAEALRAAGRAGLAAVTGKDRRILAIAVPNGPTLVVDLATGALGPIGDALGQVTLVGHDLRSVTALLQAIGIQPTSLFDTAVAWKLYDGGRHDDDGFFSFANAWRTLFGTDLPTYPSADAQVQEQARVVLALETEFRSVLAEDGLEEVAALEFSLLPIVVEMEATGIAIDSAAWKQVTTAWKEEAEALRTTVSTTLGVKNLDDDKQVLAALQRLGIPVERTNGEALAQYNNLPVVAQLGRYRSLIGFVRSSGKAVLEALDRSPDGRVHTSIHQLGARTGRVSCSEPNLMGLPRARDIRACIGAPPGKKLVIGDYKAIEMRVIADQTGDEHLRKVFTGEEGDPHRHTASVLLKKAEENVTDEERKPAKPVNFGLSFGMSSKTLVTYARKNFKVVLTEAQAEKFKATFLDHYAGVRVWQEKTANEMLGQLRTRSGRVTYYPYSDEGFNARLSFPIQGTAADGMKAAIVLLHPRLAALGARIVLVVHDELVVEAPEEHADEVRVLMRECMIAGMQRYVPSVPIIVEPEVRSTWAE
jgi:DNA polymerase-1